MVDAVDLYSNVYAHFESRAEAAVREYQPRADPVVHEVDGTEACRRDARDLRSYVVPSVITVVL